VQARRTVLDLLLSDHPLDCLTCEKNGDCKLQEYCYRYGLQESSYAGERHHYPVDDSNPFVYRDMNKCIQCGRCVRACAEIIGQDNISFINRGFHRKVATYADKSYADSICTFCGNCVAVCPTGALIEKPMIGEGRRWELERVKTTCPFCGTGCNFDLCVKDGKVVGVLSNPTSVVNGRALCIKGRFGWDYINNEERLTTPLIRKNGKFETASWDEAISLITTRLREIKEKYGPNAFGALSSARCTNEENYLMQKFTRAVMGTNNVDHCART
jgi:formate dehydrogenase alpha subunit